MRLGTLYRLSRFHFRRSDLANGALRRFFIRTPAEKLGSVSESSAGKMVILEFADKLELEREPFGIALVLRPAAGTSGSFAGETRAAHEGFEKGLKFFAIFPRKAGTEPNMVQLARGVIKSKQQ